MYQTLLELSGEHPVQYWKYPQDEEDAVEIFSRAKYIKNMEVEIKWHYLHKRNNTFGQ